MVIIMEYYDYMDRIGLEQLGPALREKRGSRGIREVAEEIGISSATLSRVENGKQPDLENFSRLCAWLQIDPGAVLGVRRNPIEAQISEVAYAHFRTEKTINSETANHLGRLILAVQQAIKS